MKNNHYQVKWDDVFGWLKRAQESLKQAQLNLEKGWFAATLSRAYYARFYSALAALLAQGIVTPPKIHDGLQTLFSKYLIKTKKLPSQLSSDLSSSFGLRQDADYNLKAEFHYQDSKRELQKAEQFLNTITQFINTQQPED